MPRVVEFVDALEALARAGVPFVVVGVGGINFYAARAADAVVAEDLDLLLERSAGSLRLALHVLGELGFAFEAGSEPSAPDAASFEIGAATVRVGRLERLLRAKQMAGRPKDLEFLRMFAARFSDPDANG